MWKSLKNFFFLLVWKTEIIFQTWSFDMHSDNFILILLMRLIIWLSSCWILQCMRFVFDLGIPFGKVKSGKLHSKLHKNPVYSADRSQSARVKRRNKLFAETRKLTISMIMIKNFPIPCKARNLLRSQTQTALRLKLFHTCLFAAWSEQWSPHHYFWRNRRHLQAAGLRPGRFRRPWHRGQPAPVQDRWSRAPQQHPCHWYSLKLIVLFHAFILCPSIWLSSLDLCSFELFVVEFSCRF